MAQMTILTGPERRRRWSDEQRERILAEAFQSGARVLRCGAGTIDVARSLIFQWRRAAVRQAEPVFVPVVVDDTPRPVSEQVVAAVLDLPTAAA